MNITGDDMVCGVASVVEPGEGGADELPADAAAVDAGAAGLDDGVPAADAITPADPAEGAD
jgi:hypothetical protein